MLSLLLLEQIAELFLMMLMGWGVVKAGVLRSEDSRPLSLTLLYLMVPCSIVNAFQIERTAEAGERMLLALIASLLLLVLPLLLAVPAGKLFRLDGVEKASSIYSNCTNMIIPLVTALFGEEWIVYTSIFGALQIILVWTHCRMLVSGQKQFSLRDVVRNINILAIGAGLLLFLLRLRLPPMIRSVTSQMTGLIGPTAMLVVGMLMAGIDWRRARSYLRMWRVVLLRLLVFPLLGVLAAKYSGLAALAPDGEQILLVCLLSTVTPSANIVAQFCQLYDNQKEYASLINAVTMLLCIVTMPVMVALYQM